MLDIENLSRNEQLFDGRYRLLRTLSTDGASADIWLALDVNTINGYAQYEEDTSVIDESSGMLVAIKIYRPKNALDIEGEQRFREEFKIAYNCHHSNLLQPTGFNIYQGIPYLVLPYCEAGSSEQFIGKKLPDDKIWKFILDVASGLDRLHANQPQIIHQDIKPANILIDDNFNFTITDFGISTKKTGGQENEYDEYNSGTMAYMAPERFQNDADPIPESDIWAFGATLCEILTGQVPFGENGGLNQKEKKVAMPSLSELPSSFRSLIRACLQEDPRKRPTARQIMEIAQAKHYPGKSTKTFAIIIACLLLLGAVAYFIFMPEQNGPTTKPVKKDSVQVAYNYAEVEKMLLNENSCQKGLHLLDSLIDQNDYQAIFLKSRLYFDNSDERDELFYEEEWKNMQQVCKITSDNRKAHALLMRAFTLREDDPVLLFQLGLDFHAPGERRGCEKKPEYAVWCYTEAEKALGDKTDAVSEDYRQNIRDKKESLKDINPEKPQ